MPDLMIDLETWGTRRGDPVITEIGWATFVPNGKGALATGVIFVDPQSCIDLGMSIESDTVKWWLEQDDLARQRQARREDELPIGGALYSLSRWFEEGSEIHKVWANPSSFDLSILRHYYQVWGSQDTPWDRRNVRCGSTLIRTAEDIANFDPSPFLPPRTAHRGDVDAERQVVLIQQAWKALRT